MNALLLPGNSPRHATWIEDLKEALSTHFENSATQHYHHWQSGEEWANVDYEIDVAKEKSDQLQPYVIIGKSIGTVIATKGTAEKLLHPEKIILLGIPINGGAKVGTFSHWLTSINIPIVIAQNTADPLGSFADVKTAFENVGGHVSFIELPGTTHDYLDFAAIAKLI